jgi:serine phosphatase RsbU (regulator of sigma subunit)
VTAAALVRPDTRRRRPLGLSTKIYLAIAAAVAFTLAASIVAWISFVELGHLQRQITGQHVPSIINSLRLARQSALIAASAPALVAAADEADRDRVMIDLRSQQLVLERSIDTLAQDMAGDANAAGDLNRVAEIRDTSQNLSSILNQLDHSVRRQLGLRAELARRTEQATEYHRQLIALLAPLLDDATLHLVTGYRRLDDAVPEPPAQRFTKDALLSYGAMAQLSIEGNLIGGLLADAANIPDVAWLGPLRERFEAAAERFARALEMVAAAEAETLRATSAALIAMGAGDYAIFALRERLLRESAAGNGFVEQSRVLAAGLTDEVDRLVHRVEARTEGAVAASNHAIDLGGNLLFALNGLAIIGAIAIGWFYVARHLTAPIVRITSAAADFEQLRFDPAALAAVRQRSDELGDLARTFTRMAAEVQARTETLDQLVRERTHELDRKNAALEESLKQIAEELQLAQRMQLSILPKTYPDLPRLEMYARMRAAREVGGDFYDIFELDEDRAAIVIADVSGKGVPAALFMAVSCTVIKSVASRGGNPGEVLARANDILCEGNEAGLFVTVFYGVIDHRAGTLIYANGGHNPPYLTRQDRSITALKMTDGIALGVVPDLVYQEQAIELCPEDTLFFYTDGITEAFDPAGNTFSELRLMEVLYESRGLSVEALGHRVIGDVEIFADGAPQSDDITCVVARFRAAANQAEAA